MNKIVIVNDKIKTLKINNKIKIDLIEKQSLFGINKINIDTLDNTDLFIDIESLELSKINFNINVNHNINIFIYSHGLESKIKYNYKITSKAHCDVVKYNHTQSVKEMVDIVLNQKYASINYNMKSIGIKHESYDYVIHHNCKNTISNIKNNCVNKEGNMSIQISGYVPKDIVGCVCNQSNRIINLTNKKCEIRPNLFIGCDDVSANHSALIGKFSDEEIFYLNSRGINEIDATNLLIKGFLLSGIENKSLNSIITKDIDKYWR